MVQWERGGLRPKDAAAHGQRGSFRRTEKGIARYSSDQRRKRRGYAHDAHHSGRTNWKRQANSNRVGALVFAGLADRGEEHAQRSALWDHYLCVDQRSARRACGGTIHCARRLHGERKRARRSAESPARVSPRSPGWWGRRCTTAPTGLLTLSFVGGLL